MRTTPEECAELGRTIARKLNAAKGPVALYIPLRGVSAIATQGSVFHNPQADGALVANLKEHLARASKCTSSTWTSTTPVLGARWRRGCIVL